MRYAITLSYNGGQYHGWQRQPNALSVQEVLEKQLETLCGHKIALTGCGRTDTGVHAKHFIAHFDFMDTLPDRMVLRLNGMLPTDIAVQDIQAVKDTFHARFHAIRRDYTYHLHFAKDPFKEGFSWFKYQYPNFELMNEAAQLLIGKKEFACFCKGPAPGGSYWCEVFEAHWEFDKFTASFHIGADRFLRNMVRATVGTLLDVGYGKISINEFSEILQSKSRSDAGKSVHACGLYLQKVSYPEGALSL